MTEFSYALFFKGSLLDDQPYRAGRSLCICCRCSAYTHADSLWGIARVDGHYFYGGPHGYFCGACVVALGFTVPAKRRTD